MDTADPGLWWTAAGLLVGIPAFVLVARRRGRPGDPVPRGEPPIRKGGIPWAILLLGAYLAILVVAGVVLVSLPGAAPDPAGMPYEMQVALDGGAKTAALLAVGVLSLLLSRGPAGRPAPPGRAAAAGALAGLAFLPVMLGTVHLQGWLLGLLGHRMEAQDLVLKALGGSPWTFWVVAAFAITVAPLFEETLFRGFLYAGLRVRLGPAASAVLSAAAFAIWHVQPDAFPVTFLLGLWLADVRERTGGLSAPIALHACYNAFQMAGILALRSAGPAGG